MPNILSIEKKRGVVQVVLQDAPVLRIPGPLYRERPLRVGEEIDAERHTEWMSTRAYGFALDAAVLYLTARPRTIREVSERLSQAAYDEQTIDRVLARLARDGYLNDAVFADQWILSRSSRALGPHRLLQELKKKGIEPDIIASALAQVDTEEERCTARAHAEKLLARTRGKDARDIRNKVMQALVRRGYSWEIARQAVLQEDFDSM